MYERFFNLTAEPFRLSPDHRFCYNHPQYAKAKAYMAYAFMRAEGFVMVTGQPGTGKTTLIGDLVESLADENVAVANLVSTQLAEDDLLRMVAFAFGLTAEGVDKSTLLQQLTTRFRTLHREGGRALLIVDEAQDLTPRAMEELRLLTNLLQDGSPLLQIFLLGQPELRDLVHDQAMEQVHQRIVAASHLRALELDETRVYVEHRLQVVGWRNDPAISTAVFPIIHRFSDGVPRRINLICSRLFLHTCVEQRHQIFVEDARVVVSELQEEQLSTSNMLNEDLFFAEDVFENSLPVEALQTTTDLRVDAATTRLKVQENVVEIGVAAARRPSYGLAEQRAEPENNFAELPSGKPLLDNEEREQPEVRPRIRAVPLAPQKSGEESGSPAPSSGSGLVSKETWITLLLALVAGGVVALIAGMDRFL